MRQIEPEDLGVIRITSAPEGDAPDWVREEWVGVEMPCLYHHDGRTHYEGDVVLNVVSGLETPDFPGYVVLQDDAIDALKQWSPKAAQYWKELGFPESRQAVFLFDEDSADVLKPVGPRAEFWKQHGDA